MIDIQEVTRDIPHCDTFCSVEKLRTLTEALRADSRFEVGVAGMSAGGVPIHHVRFGKGAVKALFVASPHCMEPIGSLTVFSLMTLLQRGHRALTAADVEWHIVPCIDPDGALLNEGWTQRKFSLQNFLRNFYLQPYLDQVDTSFQIAHKKLVFDQPSTEARVLQGVLDRVQPDFFFSLHNTFAGGAFYLTTRNLGRKYYEQIYRLLDEQRIPIRAQPQFAEFLAEYSTGIVEIYSMVKHYDFLERTMAFPEQALQAGASSFDYLAQIKPEALTFIAEMGYFQHPACGSRKDTGQNLRHFKLHIDADMKFVAMAVLEEWEKVEGDLDRASPFYRAMKGFALPTREKVIEGGMPISRYPTRDTLFNTQYDRAMTEGEKFDACIVNDGLKLLAFNYQFLRLLAASHQTQPVQQAAARIEQVLADAFAGIGRHLDLDSIEVFDCDRLTRVQLGSGLVALNSLLERA